MFAEHVITKNARNYIWCQHSY